MFQVISKIKILFMSDYTRKTIHYRVWCVAIVQTYFTASRRECINFYRNTMTASSLSRPETPDEHRQFPVRVVNDASSFNFRCAASFGEGALSVIAVAVSFREFSRLIRRTISRLHFRRPCRRLSSSRSSGKHDVFSWKISECTRFVERFVSSTDRFVVHTRFHGFTRLSHIEQTEIKRYLRMIYSNINPFYLGDFTEWSPSLLACQVKRSLVIILISLHIIGFYEIQFLFSSKINVHEKLHFEIEMFFARFSLL